MIGIKKIVSNFKKIKRNFGSIWYEKKSKKKEQGLVRGIIDNILKKWKDKTSIGNITNKKS